MTRRRLAVAGAVLLVAACVERLTAPGQCPDYCPSGQITVVDTLLTTSINRDSSYRGYVLAHQAPLMLAAHLPGATDTLDGRPIFRINGYGSRLRISTADTATGLIRGADSARLQLYIVRRDTATRNLQLQLYRLPIKIDTTTTFDSVESAFNDSLVKTVNIDTLLAQPGRKDPVTGDSVVVDTVNHRLVLSLKLDTAAARYVGTDSGTVAYGIRIAAATDASIAFGKGPFGPVLQWYLSVDSLGIKPVTRTPGALAAAFATFVFAPPPAPLDSTLAVGGVPAARSLLRVAFPKVIRDSSQIIRATLFLVRAVPARGAPADSFVIEARTVFADFGGKSPIDLRLGDTTVIHPGATDTVVKIEVTNLLQLWAADSTHPTVLVLRAQAEAQFLGEIRFYPSVAAALRPTLQVTFVRRFPFGVP